MSRYNAQQPSFTTTTGGKNPKQIHIAHRRSPSELTNLMMEQIALQRQLDIVQQQQHQLMAQQGGAPQQLNPSPLHRRTGSNATGNTHRRAQSSVTGAMGSFAMPNVAPPPKSLSPQQQQQPISQAQGHVRRHSLGLNEAKRAAAQVQAQRAGKEVVVAEDEETMPPPSGFKFPSTVVEPPAVPGASKSQGHSRSRSSAQSPQRASGGYQFPPQADSNNLLQVANHPQGHERRQSGHNRTNSRSQDPNIQQSMNQNWRNRQGRQQSQQFDNELLMPPPQQQFIPGHRTRGSHGGSISSMSGFQTQGGRKSLFAPYLPQNSIPELVAEGRLVVGTLRVNKKNRSDAYVATDGLLDADIFICGSKDRNRALEGDLVAVELLSVDEVWSSKREKEEKKRRKDNNTSDGTDDVHNDASTHSSSAGSEHTEKSDGLQRKGSLKQRPTLKKNDDVEVEGQSLLLVEEEEISDEYKPLYAGHVVAVIDRIPGQLFAGTLGLLRPSQQVKEQSQPVQRPKIVWFKPTDKKVPLIAIPTEQTPRDFVENVDKYTNKLFVASIKRWPITSLHPFGTLISELGPLNDPKIEVDAILRDNNFLCEEYLDDSGVERDDFELNVVDLEAEFQTRRDFSNEYVLAVSETGATSDHAVHVKRISDGKIELGVHIADVTEYVKEGSSLDKNARKRSTSVFLAQKTVDLLPKSVNEFLSFNKGEKKLSVSVIFEIDTAHFEIDNVWVGESCIEPKNRLTYDQIDSILKDGNDAEEISSASKDYVKTFALISKEFKRERLGNSTLDNDVVLSLLDTVDDEKVRLSLNLFESSPCSSILTEIFLKVNSAVAQRVYAILGDSAFLRRHTIPTLQKLETFKRKVTSLGIDLDTTSPASLINSIVNIEDKVSRESVEILLFKALSRAKYFVAGKVDPENYVHYYFNLPLFTHFTSPLRRYADLIVHRQLKQTLRPEGAVVVTQDDLESLKMTAEYCNFKKDCAKAAQDQSVHLLLSQTINDMSRTTGQLVVMGSVLQVYESAFDVFIPEFGIEKRVHGDQLPLKKAEFDKKNSVLELYWERGVDTATYIPEDEREPLSYRNSIKNKFKTGVNEIARENSTTSDMIAEFEQLKLTPPEVKHRGDTLEELIKGLAVRVDGEDRIQEVRELAEIPVFLRAEIGMALPCLTVHAVNPFTNA